MVGGSCFNNRKVIAGAFWLANTPTKISSPIRIKPQKNVHWLTYPMYPVHPCLNLLAADASAGAAALPFSPAHQEGFRKLKCGARCLDASFKETPTMSQKPLLSISSGFQ
jgi:hypothetical protein